MTGNNISKSNEGIFLYSSTSNVLKNNSMTDNLVDLDVYGSNISHYINDVDVSNTVDGKPIYYWIDVHDTVVPPDAGYAVLVNCSHVTAEELNFSGNGTGVLLAYTTESEISGNSGGLKLFKSPNNAIIENNIANGICGIELFESSNTTIIGSNITGCSAAISVSRSSGTNIVGNNITNCHDGITLEYATGNYLSNNRLNKDLYPLIVDGSSLDDYMQSIATSNLADAKPMYYFVNENNLTVCPETHPEIGYLAFVNCTGIRVENLTLLQNREGLLLAFTEDSEVRGNNMTANFYGIHFECCYRNIVENNTVSGLGGFGRLHGLFLHGSLNNSIVGNKIEEYSFGVYCCQSYDNVIERNDIKGNSYGIQLIHATGNVLLENNISDSVYGIQPSLSYDNKIAGNNVSDCLYGIYMVGSSSNRIWHNCFERNTYHAYNDESSINFWDDGYPSGGNYWSAYASVDSKSGPFQNETGSDGIWDNPYVIDANNQDRYPLVSSYTPPRTYVLTITATAGGTIDPPTGTHSYTVNSTVQITAFPNVGYVFDYWEFDGINVGSDNPHTVLMNADHSLKAVFLFVGGTIYIRADGSVDPPTAPIQRDGDTYTLRCSIVSDSDGIVVERSNMLLDGTGYTVQAAIGWEAITLAGTSNVTIGNVKVVSLFGIGLYDSVNNKITGNTFISEGGYWIIFTYSSSDNLIYHNNFIGTTSMIGTNGSTNTWDNGYEGNYWSDYAGTDSDGDGIGDTPYVIDSNNQDNYPLMNLLWNWADVNHDLKVEAKDVFKVALAYGTSQSGPNPPGRHWNPHCDINEDGKIDMKDYYIVCKNYGKTYS
jgi:parallel beta-helix repeat protein